MAVKGANSPNISTMSGPTTGVYHLRVIDLDHLPPYGNGGMFATWEYPAMPLIMAPNDPLYFDRQGVCNYQ
jgi:hypothetical protein